MEFYEISFLYVGMVFVTVSFMLHEKQKWYCISKALTSAVFVFLAILLYLQKDEMDFRWMLTGLFFCFLGDILLALAHEIDNRMIKKWFVPGVFSFMLAHLSFVYGYMQLAGQKFLQLILMAALVTLYTFYTTRSHLYDYQGFHRLCIVYSFFVGMFFGSGIGVLYQSWQKNELRFFGVGAVLFLISDALLSAKYFMKKTPKFATCAILPIYYAGIYFMLLAVH